MKRKPIIEKLDYNTENYYCPHCKKQVYVSWDECPSCKQKLNMTAIRRRVYDC